MPATRTQTGFYDVSIAPEFGVVAGFFKQLSRQIEDTAQSSSTAGTTKAGQGQVSLVQYNMPTPIQLKIAAIMKLIENGKIKGLPGKADAETIKEIAKHLTKNASTYESKSIEEIIFDLKTKNPKLLLDDTQPKLKHPTPAFANAFRPAAPAMA